MPVKKTQVKKRRLTDSEIRGLSGLKGKAKREKWRELVSLRRRRKYGTGFREPARFLEIAPRAERDAAFKHRKMVFYEGKRRITIPLSVSVDYEEEIATYHTMGIVRAGNELFMPAYAKTSESEVIRFFRLTEKGEIKTRDADREVNWISCNSTDMGHIRLPDFERRNMTLPIMQIATEHAIGKMGVATAQVFLKRYKQLFEKLGFKEAGRKAFEGFDTLQIAEFDEYYGGAYSRAGIMRELITLRKTGEKNRNNDLSKTHRFVAVDHQSGEIKSFYYPRGREIW